MTSPVENVTSSGWGYLGKFYEKWGIFWPDLGNFDICGWQHCHNLSNCHPSVWIAHVDFKYPIEEDRMEVRWQLIKPKLDSKCRSQRRLQREQKWRFEQTNEKQQNTASTPKPKRATLDVEEREMLLYGSPKTVLTPVYTGNTGESAGFSEGQEGYLANPDE